MAVEGAAAAAAPDPGNETTTSAAAPPVTRPAVLCRSYTTLLSATAAGAPAAAPNPAPAPPPHMKATTYHLTRYYQKCQELKPVKWARNRSPLKTKPAASEKPERDTVAADSETKARFNTPIKKTDPERLLLLKRLRLRQEARHDQAPILFDLVKRSVRALVFTKAGNSFRSIMDDEDVRLYTELVQRAMGLGLDQVIPAPTGTPLHKRSPTGVAPATTNDIIELLLVTAVTATLFHLSGLLSATVTSTDADKTVGLDRVSKVPLILNVDSTLLSDDPFYDFLLHHLPKSARLYAKGSKPVFMIRRPPRSSSTSTQVTSSTPRHRRHQTSLSKRHDVKLPSIDLLETVDERVQNDAHPQTPRTSTANTDHSRRQGEESSEQSFRKSCMKFDQMRIRLSRRLEQRVAEFESARSASNRAKIQVADHQFSFRSSSRDMSEMRQRAEMDQSALRALRLEHFRKLDQVMQQVRGHDNGNGRRDLTPNECAILQTIAGYLHSPYGGVLNHHSAAHFLEAVDHEILNDPAVLKILLEFISKVGISENDFRAALAASQHEFPASLFDLANIVKNNAVATMMGGLRSAGLAGRLLRKRKDQRLSFRRHDSTDLDAVSRPMPRTHHQR